MNRTQTLQDVLDYIDDNRTNALSVAMIADRGGYSAYHFSRIFTEEIDIPVMSYVTWRRLQYALYDLSLGKKVIDVAMEYGFETHGGFTKAFVHWFGFPPFLCRLRLTVHPPTRPNVQMIKNKFLGGNAMSPHIMELTPFPAVGYPTRHRKEHVNDTIKTPSFWETTGVDYGALLSKLYDTFPKSKHLEITMCYDLNESTGEFTYLVGRGIDNPDDLANIRPDMTRVDIAGGLYAIFSTPPAVGSQLSQTIQDTWNEIFLHWLPQSEFEYDEMRYDFGYHDHREHGWYFDGKEQIDIYIPIRQREEEVRKSQLRASR